MKMVLRLLMRDLDLVEPFLSGGQIQISSEGAERRGKGSRLTTLLPPIWPGTTRRTGKP